MWFLSGWGSSSSWCLGWAALFYCCTPWSSIYYSGTLLAKASVCRRIFSSFLVLFGLKLYVPVNNFSVKSGRSHRFIGITSTFWDVNVSCLRIQHGYLSEDRTPDLSLQSPTLYYQATAPPFFFRIVVFFYILKRFLLRSMTTNEEPYCINTDVSISISRQAKYFLDSNAFRVAC